MPMAAVTVTTDPYPAQDKPCGAAIWPAAPMSSLLSASRCQAAGRMAGWSNHSARTPMRGTWQPVMGHIEPGERARDTAVRELHEELGLAPGHQLVRDAQREVRAVGLVRVLRLTGQPGRLERGPDATYLGVQRLVEQELDRSRHG